MTRFRAAPSSNLPRFWAVGRRPGYDTVRYVETTHAQPRNRATSGTPDIPLFLSEELAVVDNPSGKLTLVVYAEPVCPVPYRKRRPAYEGNFSRPAGAGPDPGTCNAVAAGGVGVQARPHSKQAVGRAKQYIKRWRHHAGRALAAHDQAIYGSPLSSLPRAAHAESSPYMF